MLNDTFPRAVIFTFSFYTSLFFFEPLKLISPREKQEKQTITFLDVAVALAK